jgi:predicted DNA-binding protein|tara:strand:+ start:2999 stop:3196 length:198 start_codon:yes stop_codon:yes gene_type:complete
MSTFCTVCGCDPCDCHGAEVKHKNICISMNPESLQQLKEIHDKTGKSKSRIVRDAIKKEYKEIRK